MPDSTRPVPRLVLLGPPALDEAAAEALRAPLAAACAVGDVAAVILDLAPGDERGLVNRVKGLAPVAQAHGAAVLVAVADRTVDAVAVAARGGADGVHLDGAEEAAFEAVLGDLRGRLREGRILGCGGVLASRHAAMAAGEAGVDYVMFGGAGAADEAEVLARAAWWAEIFETPCIAVAGEVEAVPALAATGAEFVALDAGLWRDDPEAVGRALAALAAAGTGR